MNKCILIQANGNNLRLGKFFRQPKYELFYKNIRIIESIIRNSLEITDNVYVAVRKNSKLNFDTKNINIIQCDKTNTRLETLKQCFPHLTKYESVIIHDCDTIIESKVLKNLNNNSIAITNYKLDGYIIPKNDSFFTEQLKHDRLKLISNFSGSAGMAVVLKKKNYLFVDSRYTIQARLESGKNFKIIKKHSVSHPD